MAIYQVRSGSYTRHEDGSWRRYGPGDTFESSDDLAALADILERVEEEGAETGATEFVASQIPTIATSSGEFVAAQLAAPPPNDAEAHQVTGTTAPGPAHDHTVTGTADSEATEPDDTDDVDAFHNSLESEATESTEPEEPTEPETPTEPAAPTEPEAAKPKRTRQPRGR